MTCSTVSRLGSSITFSSTRLMIDSTDRMPMKISYSVFFSSLPSASAMAIPVPPVRSAMSVPPRTHRAHRVHRRPRSPYLVLTQAPHVYRVR